MVNRDDNARREYDWATGRDLTDTGTAFEVDAFRRALEIETGTLSGFRRRVRTDREWSILPLVVGIPILLFQLVELVWTFVGDPDGRADAAWQRYADSASPSWAVVGVVLVLAAVVSTEARIRREFRLFRREGWVALQAPTGLVELSTEGAGQLVYDHRSLGAPSQYRARDLRNPLVLVSAAQMPVDAFARALGSARATTIARVFGSDDLATLRRQLGTFRAVPTAEWFADAPGCLVAQGDGVHVVTAIPRAWKGGIRVRLGRIRLRDDEARRFSGPIATPPAVPTTAEQPRVGGSVTGAAGGGRASRRNRVVGVLIGVAVLLVGPVMIGVGSAMTASDNALLETGTRAAGTVGDVRDGAEASDHRFRVDFSSDDSSAHSVWLYWELDEKPSIGDDVTVVYSASDPGSAVVEGYDGDGTSVVGLGAVFTVLFGLIGAGMFFSFRRGRASRRRAGA